MNEEKRYNPFIFDPVIKGTPQTSEGDAKDFRETTMKLEIELHDGRILGCDYHTRMAIERLAWIRDNGKDLVKDWQIVGSPESFIADREFRND